MVCRGGGRLVVPSLTRFSPTRQVMDALLLYPEFPATFWSFEHALEFTDREATLPPLGLLTVAALLPDAWNLRLVDLNVRDLRAEDLRWADVALVGGTTVQHESAQQVVGRCERAEVPIVAGGPLFVYEHDDFPAVDHFVLGEAEASLPPFLADFREGVADRMYRADRLPDVADSPVPRWDLLEIDAYASMAVQYSRGCPYDCEFCNVTALFGRRPRVKDPGQVLAELDALYESGWRGSVFFADDNLIGNRRRVTEELMPALLDWNRERKLPFFTQASVNLADDEELLEDMVEAGFTAVFLGIETPDEEALREANKKHNVGRDLTGDVRRIQRAGLEVQGGFIVGFDSDSPDAFRRQRQFIQESGIVTAMVGLLQAPPGTRLEERLAEEGRLRGRMTGDNVDGTTNVVPEMGLEALEEGYRELLDGLYSPGPFYERVKNFLREYRPGEARVPLTWGKVRGFFRSLYVLGFREEGGGSFWGLILWVLTRRPRLLPVALKQSVFGLHFRRVYEERIAS